MPGIVTQWFAALSPELATFLIAMVPVTELRASIPIALLVYNLPVWKAVALSIVGDIIPAVFIYFYAGPVALRLSAHSRLLRRFFSWLFAHTRTRFIKKHERYGALALLIFVGIPLPFTGAWTGSLAAWLFAIPKRYALPSLIAGVVVAAFLMVLITLGTDSIWDLFS